MEMGVRTTMDPSIIIWFFVLLCYVFSRHIGDYKLKKIVSIVAVILAAMFLLSAQERVLFDASKLSEATYQSDNVQTDNDAEKWIVDFNGSGAGGSGKASLIKNSDKGVGVKIEIDSTYFKDKAVSATIRPNILPQLTENESGNGRIENVADIKSIKITGHSLGYEATVSLDLERSDGTKIGIKPQQTQQLGSAPFEVVWDNPSYIEDPAKRDIKLRPVYPNTVSEIILNGITIRGKPFYVGNKGYLIVYLSTVTVVADKAYEEADSADEDLWGIEAANKEKYGKIQEKELERKEILRAQEQALMATEGNEQASSSEADAK